MKKPKQPLAYDVRFERGRFVLHARAKEARVAARLDPWERSGLVLAGLLVAALGFGMIALVGSGLSDPRISVPVKLAFCFFSLLLLGIGLYGCDLIGRGITGRPWSQHFWKAADARFARLKPVKMTFIFLVLVGGPFLFEAFEKGPARWEVLIFLLVVFLHVFCHEIGHLSASGAVGYRPRWLSAGPLVVHVDGPRSRLGLNRSWLLFFGGVAAYEPVGRTREKDLLVILAGPLTNLLLAGLALDHWDWPQTSGLFEVFLRSFIGLGFAIAALNLIPLPRTAQGYALDGRELVDLLRGRR